MANHEFLSEEELDALMEGIAKGKIGNGLEGAEEFQPYELVSPENAIVSLLPLLEIVHERFTYQLQAGLFELLRRDVEVIMGAVEVGGYNDFIATLTAPCSINLISLSPLSGPGLLVFDYPLVFVVVDTFFGGAGHTYSPLSPRDFSATDVRLIKRLLELSFRALGAAWKPFLAVQCGHLGSEHDPHFVTDINPAEAMVVINLEIRLDKTTGNLQLVLPCSLFEPVRSELLAGLSKEHPNQDERLTQLLREGLKDSQVGVRCLLAETELSLRDLLSLQAGDFIPMDIPAQAILEAEGIPVYAGRYGVSKGWRAIEIQRRLTALDGGPQSTTERT